MAVSTAGGTTLFPQTASAVITPSADTDTYYKEASGKSGTALKSALHRIISGHTKLSYSQVWNALKETDEDPANPNNVILLYTQESRPKVKTAAASGTGTANTCGQSHTETSEQLPATGTDIHHLRPADVQVNSARGNMDFDNGGSEYPKAPGNYYDGDSWEPRDEVKGDVARMLFYMAVRYEGEDGYPDLELNDKTGNGSAPYMGKLSVLLKWNQQDPVDSKEKRRNEIIYEDYQHNRNPFIDHPEWADEIW